VSCESLTRVAEVPPHPIEFERLNLLYDYTKFHIGLYTTLVAALVAARETIIPRAPAYLRWTLLFFLVAGAAGGVVLVAGAAGGVVASNVPDFSTYSDFLNTRIGPFGWKPMCGLYWSHLEHLAFWLGIGWAGLNAILGPKERNRLSTGFSRRRKE
jgi:hypothetical protein